MRLAGARNLDIRIADARLAEAWAQHEAARMQFFPYLTPGFSFRRHEGNIQTVEGPIIDADKESIGFGVGSDAPGRTRRGVLQGADDENARGCRRALRSRCSGARASGRRCRRILNSCAQRPRSRGGGCRRHFGGLHAAGEAGGGCGHRFQRRRISRDGAGGAESAHEKPGARAATDRSRAARADPAPSGEDRTSPRRRCGDVQLRRFAAQPRFAHRRGASPRARRWP